MGIVHVLPKTREWQERRALGPSNSMGGRMEAASTRACPFHGLGMVGAVGSGPFFPHGSGNGRSDPVSRNQKPSQPGSSRPEALGSSRSRRDR